jgi:hypothetical protein
MSHISFLKRIKITILKISNYIRRIVFIPLGFDVVKFLTGMFKVSIFFSDYKKYKNMANNNALSLLNIYPCLHDKSDNTPFDAHYLYHPAWAARKIAIKIPQEHIDFSSKLDFATVISAFIPVKYFDFRPAEIKLSGLSSSSADLTDLKEIPDNSILSMSCMHVIEHIGLGRYGDPVDPEGDKKAIQELLRVLAINGDLYFVTPVGQPKIKFNAHRIYSFEQIIKFFNSLKLLEFSLIDDNGSFISPANPELVKLQTYGCGCFHFQKL